MDTHLCGFSASEMLIREPISCRADNAETARICDPKTARFDMVDFLFGRVYW